MTQMEFYAFLASLETQMLTRMEQFAHAAKASLDKGEEVDAYAKGAIVVMFDEFRQSLGVAYEETFAGSSNGRTTDFESENVGSIPTPAAKKLH